ncbi:MAG: GAF domain-containing protein [Xenococcaceae cyanobacterium MO_188.B32]|nr:GAF domain-containing protein [Xenococcaceae cyanobacterium MO_188.B32]
MNKNLLPESKGDRIYSLSQHNLSENSFINSKPKKTLSSKITAALAIAMVTLPVLSVGIANYYFDRQGINKQEIRARGTDTPAITTTQLAQRNRMLTIVLVSTGTTALIVGIITAWWTIRITSWNYQQAEKLAKQRKEQQKKLFQEFIKYLSRALDAEEILEATVEEAQKILECDRVFVYSLKQHEYGKIIAEAVLPGLKRALDKTLEDPSLEVRYIEKHGDVSFYAFDDIDRANLSPRYLEQLEKLEVKANLVVPICHENEFLAILSAHHCATPHDWQQEEKEFLTELAARVSFALDNIKILAEASSLLAQAKTEEYWTQLLNEMVGHLRQSLQEEEILNIAVEKIRQVLTCDRVLVYSLNEDRYGMVIAESVAGGWMRSLGLVIEDPCFDSKCMKAYSQGRVKATDNIYEAGLSECYLEQLEKLEVKANLITPIIVNNKLFGLLIVHQCSAPRSWQENEIRWLTQVAERVGFTLDRAKLSQEQQDLLKRLETEAQWNQLFSDTVGYIRQSLQEEDILRTTVEQVRQVLKCDRVVVYSLNENNYGMAIEESVGVGWTRVLGKTIEDPCFATNYISKYSDGRVKVTDNIYDAQITDCYLEQLEKLEVKANLVTPILHQQKLFGLLIAHQCSQPRSWQQYEIRWLTQIARQVGFALDNAEILKQSQNQKQTDVVTLANYKELPTEIIPVETTAIEISQDSIEQDIAMVQEKLVETKEKIKQINQATQKLLQIQDSINSKLKRNK